MLVAPTCTAGPQVLQENIAQSIELSLLDCHLPTEHPGKRPTHTWLSTWCKAKWDLLDQAAFFHFSMLKSWCSCAHCWCFQECTGVSMETLIVLQQCSAVHSKLWYAVHSDILNQQTFFSAMWAKVARDHTSQPSVPPCISKLFRPMTLVTGSPLVFLWTTVDYEHSKRSPNYHCSDRAI